MAHPTAGRAATAAEREAFVEAVDKKQAEATAAYADATVVEHAGGHELPISLRRDAAFSDAVDAFFRGVL